MRSSRFSRFVVDEDDADETRLDLAALTGASEKIRFRRFRRFLGILDVDDEGGRSPSASSGSGEGNGSTVSNWNDMNEVMNDTMTK